MKKVIPFIFVLILATLLLRKFYFKESFLYAGTLETTRIDIPARLATVISKTKVEEGQEVSKDQELFTLDCSELLVTQKQVSKNFARSGRLAKNGIVTEELYDDVKRRHDDIDLRISWCSVKSPIHGTVLNRYFETGEWVQPGTKLLSLADLQDIWTYIYVPQPIMNQLKVGEELMATLPSNEVSSPAQSFKGKIIKINDEAEFTPKNVQTREERTRLVYGVKVKFDNTSQVLKPGMTLEIKLPHE